MSQRERLERALEDGLPHRSDELLGLVYGSEHLGLARLAARVYEIRRALPPNQRIESWRDKERPTLTWYRLVVDAPAPDLFSHAARAVAWILVIVPWWIL